MKNIICFGDSITQCQGSPEAGRWTARLAFLLEQRFPGKFDVYNRGLGGNTTALALDRIQQDVTPQLPAIVFIEFGINDSYVYPWCQTPRTSLNDFRKNLEQIVRLVKTGGGEPYLIVNHPVTLRTDLHPQGNGESIGRNLQPYNQAIRRLAKAHRAACIDLPRLLKKSTSDPSALCSEDGVHLSPQGNRTYADCLAESIQKRRSCRP